MIESDYDVTAALIMLAESLLDSVTVGNPAPRVRRLSEWMRAAPRPGDLVVEMSTRFRGPNHSRIGLFDRYETKRVCRHEQQDIEDYMSTMQARARCAEILNARSKEGR